MYYIMREYFYLWYIFLRLALANNSIYDITIKHIIVVSGSSISYWYDAWHGNLRATACVPASQRPRISLADAWQDIEQTNPDEHLITAPTLLPGAPDLLVWRWNATGAYSAGSVYKAMAQEAWCGRDLGRFGKLRHHQQWEFSHI